MQFWTPRRPNNFCIEPGTHLNQTKSSALIFSNKITKMTANLYPGFQATNSCHFILPCQAAISLLKRDIFGGSD
jgi:hypothetical protein